jgi:hypothetical protein
MAEVMYPQSIEPTKGYVLERFDLCMDVLWKHVDLPGFEQAAEPFLEIIKEKHIRFLAEVVKDVPAEEKRDVLSSVGLKLSARISRFLGRIKRQYEALTANQAEPVAKQTEPTPSEAAVSAPRGQDASTEDVHFTPVAECQTSAEHLSGATQGEAAAAASSSPITAEAKIGSREAETAPAASARIGREEKKRGKIRSAWLDRESLERGWTSDLEISDAGGPSYNTLDRYRSGRASTREPYVRGRLAKAFDAEITQVPE